MPLLPLRRVLLGAGLLLCGCVPSARAQTAADTDEIATVARKTIAPPSPDERRQQTEDKLRALMINLGISAVPAQDSILEYLTDDERSRAALREAEKRLLVGLRRDVPPERMRDLLGDYRAAIESDKTNRLQAQRRLDVRVGYTLNPKLEAMLWLMGVLGEGASKLPTSALAFPKTETPKPPVVPGAPLANVPVYGPLPVPNFGARGEIVGTVMAKGVGEAGEHWLEIRDDSGALDRYTAPRREEIGAPDPELDKSLSETPLSARVRVQWIWQERRRALTVQTESQTVTKNPAP